jgi:hypothetical protein
MSELEIRPIGSLGRHFIAGEFLPAGRDEYYLRDEQSPRLAEGWRSLTADEIETLIKKGNSADRWNNLRVTGEFTPHLIRNCEFYGLVRIGRLEEVCLEYHEMSVPVGITDSRIIACDLGDDVAIHNVQYLAHYIIGSNVILLNIDEMHTTNHAKFGSGIVKQGEPEEVRVRLDLINEAGGRSVMPFDGMLAADATLWARHPEDKDLAKRLGEMTQRQFDPRRGFYGTVGERSVIKNSRIIKDVRIGPSCYIKGANKLKNLTINSSPEEPTQIGEGVELVNGIVGYGCHIFYGCKAVRFVIGDNSNLKYGARLIHSYLGDNSTISCCEVLNNLVFPAHEQHHNNSFLIASLVMGQSNIGAGATIGSNHNSRAPDGEIHAGRGFWPGLCVSVKHNCRFASFALLAKGDYPAELDIALPFCLVSDDVARDRLQLLPAYWWLYNMYALARNTWKFGARDKRMHKCQHIEFDALAPDTAEEIFHALTLLEEWTGKASKSAKKKSAKDLTALGRKLLTGPAKAADSLEILADGVENSDRKVVILKAHAAYHAYRRMLHYYAVKNLMAWMEANPKASVKAMADALGGERERTWVNLGGQLVAGPDLEQLKEGIKAGKLKTWDDVHTAYDALWEAYPAAKQRHALATLLALAGEKTLTAKLWREALEEWLEIQRYVADQVFVTRKKDYESPFRRMVYRSAEEMEAVLGTAEGNSFVKQVRRETDEAAKRVAALKKRA